MSTKQILIWGAVAVGGYLLYKQLTKANNKQNNPITTTTSGTGNSPGTPAQQGSATDLQGIAGTINGLAGTFENTLNGANNLLGFGTSNTGTNQTAGN